MKTSNASLMTATSLPDVDSVTVDIVGNHLLAIAEEMGVAMIRSAYSPNIKERKDCSTSLLDNHGRTIAQAEHIPIHMGSMLGFIPSIVKQYGEDIHPGDIFIGNDPYIVGSTHLPDVAVAAPIFAGNELRGFAATVAHHAEFGGALGKATDVYSEGLRVPPVRIFSRGEPDDQVLRLILANCRSPRERLGDLRSQFAAVQLGAQRYNGLCDKYGANVVLASTDQWLDKAELQVRAALAAFPPGRYTFRDFIDDDGAGTKDVEIVVTIEISPDRVHVDFTGTSAQVPGQINVVPSGVAATVFYALKAVLDPDLPANAGYYRVIEITAEEGSLLNPIDPAPVWSRSDSCQRVTESILGALAGAIPDRIPAASHGSIPGIQLHGYDPTTGEYFAYVETYGGGFGASHDHDGPNGVHSHLTNSANTPTEMLEISYPLRVRRYGLRKGSGGEGVHRGGEGLVRDIEVLAEGVRLRIKGDRFKRGPWGLDGGKEGKPMKVTIDPDTAQEWEFRREDSGKVIPVGSVVRIETAGGGGHGAPPVEAAAERSIIEGGTR